MLLPHNKCRNHTLTTLLVTYFTFSLSWFIISIQNDINNLVRAGVLCASQRFTEGRFPWLLKLSCKSSFGMEHLHPLQWPWVPQGFFQSARCSVIKRTTTQCCFLPNFAWYKQEPVTSPRNAEESAEPFNNFKVHWDSSAKETEREHCRNDCRRQVLATALQEK